MISHEMPPTCTELEVLHATPLVYIPNIVANGFQHTKTHPERASRGRGSAEDDIIFFERYNPLGARYALAWMQNLEPHRKTKNGLLRATVCSCHFLDKRTLARNRTAIARKGTDFIIYAQNYTESERPWAYDHLGSRLAESKYYDDPMSFLRKIATDADHVVYTDANKMQVKEVIRYGMGEVMTFLGYDAADGYEGSHMLSDDRNMPMNEIIVTDPTRIYDITPITPKALCDAFPTNSDLQHVCKSFQ